MTEELDGPLDVACPTCGARVGEWCQWPPFHARARHVYHLTRLDLWSLANRPRPQDRVGATETGEAPGLAPGATARRNSRLPQPRNGSHDPGRRPPIH